MKKNVLLEKSYAYSVRVVRMYQFLVREKREFVLSKQFVRAGTSIGANATEAVGALTKKEFIAKLSIAYREACETEYWIRLLTETDYIDAKAGESMRADCVELIKLITAILKSSKQEN